MKLKCRDLRELSLTRLQEAQLLLRGGCWSGAYYLAGYAVECALKACIAKATERHDFPDLERARFSYTHDLFRLLRVANLHEILKEAMRHEPPLASHWATVGEWSEETRYQQCSEADAVELLAAIQDRKYGVLAWLKKHW